MSEALNRAPQITLNSCVPNNHKEDAICIFSFATNRMFDRSKLRKGGFILDDGSVNTVYHDREGMEVGSMATGFHGHMGPGLLPTSQWIRKHSILARSGIRYIRQGSHSSDPLGSIS